MGEVSIFFRLLVKILRTERLDRSRNRWEGDIKLILERIVVNIRNFIDSAQVRDFWRILVNVLLILRVS